MVRYKDPTVPSFYFTDVCVYRYLLFLFLQDGHVVQSVREGRLTWNHKLTLLAFSKYFLYRSSICFISSSFFRKASCNSSILSALCQEMHILENNINI